MVPAPSSHARERATERAARLGATVASDSTAFWVIDSIDAAGLERLRDAVC